MIKDSTKETARKIKKIQIEKIKSLNNVTLELPESGVIALTGLNGSGKTTFLQLLACAYNQESNIEDIGRLLYYYNPFRDWKFLNLFFPNQSNNWMGSKFTYIYDNGYEIIVEKKERWMRYTKRPSRTVFYLGLNYLVADHEIEGYGGNQTHTEDLNHPLKEQCNNVLKYMQNLFPSKSYKKIKFYYKKAGTIKNFFGVDCDCPQEGQKRYTSFDMGAGERKLFFILMYLEKLPIGSLVLIDEPEALLHDILIEELLKILCKLAKKKELQVVFTTHWSKISKLSDRNEFKNITIYTLDNKQGQTKIIQGIDSTIWYDMTRDQKENIIGVEDEVAEKIVSKILNKCGKFGKYKIVKVGSDSNFNTIALMLALALPNCFLVHDGDGDGVDPKLGKVAMPDKQVELENYIFALNPDEDENGKKMNPESMLLKYGKGFLTDEQKRRISDVSDADPKKQIYDESNLLQMKQDEYIYYLIDSFAKNEKEKWEQYTADISRKLGYCSEN